MAIALVRPFRALRPRADCAARVLAPPYDVVTIEEARALAAHDPIHFLHVSRAEIDLPDGTDPYSDTVYAHAAERLAQLRAEGILTRDPTPSLYAYRLSTADHTQTGIVSTIAVAAYRANRVRRHELTRPTKENDRVRHMEALNAQTGPVLCAYRDTAALEAPLADAVDAPPLFSVDDANGVTHTIWRIDAADRIAALAAAMSSLDALYIADGHHRSAAAARVAALRGETPDGAGSHEYFLTVAFPASQLRILDYNRVVTDLAGATIAGFLREIDAAFTRRAVAAPYRPSQSGRFGMYIDRHWFELVPRTPPPADDPVRALDVSLLHDRLIEPILGVHDLRQDPRIDFVGGIRGLAPLAARVDSGAAAVAFSLFPTPIDQLMTVADADRLMPPKSTWFEPKLADGLISHVLD